MAATKTWERKALNQEVYIESDDVREIIDILEPTVDSEGNPVKAKLVVLGPKGGSLRISLPDWFWERNSSDIEVGNGFTGGWRDGKFVDPAIYIAK